MPDQADQSTADAAAKAAAAAKGTEAAKAQTQAPAALAAEERFGVPEWRSRARLQLHVSPHAVAGALSVSDQEDFSEAEVHELLDKFSQRAGVES